MPEDELTVKISADAGDFIDKLGQTTKAVQNFGNEVKSNSTEAAGNMARATDDMSRSQSQNAEATTKVSDALVEQGRQLRQAQRDYRLANIEQVQMNQLMSVMGNTCVQWGTKLQGTNNIVNKTMADMTAGLDKATGGMTTYLGAGLQLVGMGVQMYTQYSRMLIMWGMHTAAVAAEAGAEGVATVSTYSLASAMTALTAVMDANPIILVAAAIAGIVVVAAMAYNAILNYRAGVEAAKNTMIDMDIAIEKTADDMQRLAQGEYAMYDKLKKERDDAIEQQHELALAEQAALDTGQTEKYNELVKQKKVIDDTIALLEREMELAKGYGPPAGVSTDISKMAADLKTKALASFTGPEGDLKRALWGDTASKWAESWAEAYWNAMAENGGNEDAASKTADAIAGSLEDFLKGKSPPPRGPLHEIDKWGENLIKSYSEGMLRASERGDAVAQSSQIANGLAGGLSRGGSPGNAYNYDNSQRNINSTIIVQGFDFTNPQLRSKLAEAVSQEIRRLQAVS